MVTAPYRARHDTLALLVPALLVTEVTVWGYAVLRGPRFMAAKARTYSALWVNGGRGGPAARRSRHCAKQVTSSCWD